MAYQTDQVLVVSGNLLSATATDASAVVYEDIIHSNLLSQMVADNDPGTRLTDPASWLNSYKNALGNLFWKFTEYETSTYASSPGEVDVTIPQILEKKFFKNLTADQKKRVAESMSLFNNIPDDDAAALLYNLKTQLKIEPKKHPGKPPQKNKFSVNLQVSVAHNDSLVSVCSIYFQTHQEISNKLFKQNFSIQEIIGNINVFYIKADILESNYAIIRQGVINKLGQDNINTNILAVSDETEPPEAPSHRAALSYVQNVKI